MPRSSPARRSISSTPRAVPSQDSWSPPIGRPPFFGASKSVDDHGSDAFTAMHELERLVDALEWQNVGDHGIDLDLAAHVPVDDLGHIGAAASAAKGSAAPHSAGHQLKRPGRDLFPRLGDADDDALAPPAVTRL